jgi:Tryptophan-associated transmembrane protein (Trp_oprn_chp)
MELRWRSLGPTANVGLVGGALMVIGSLMTWVTVSFNAEALAKGLGVDPSVLPADSLPSQVFAGTRWSEGKIALVCGIVAVIGAILLIVATARVLTAVLLMVVGLVGAGFALHGGISRKNDVFAEWVRSYTAAGSTGDVTNEVKNWVHVSIGKGLWMCMIGSMLVLVSGILALMKRPDATAAAMSGSEVDDAAPRPPETVPR